jgi:hypothetical protein
VASLLKGVEKMFTVNRVSRIKDDDKRCNHLEAQLPIGVCFRMPTFRCMPAWAASIAE